MVPLSDPNRFTNPRFTTSIFFNCQYLLHPLHFNGFVFSSFPFDLLFYVATLICLTFTDLVTCLGEWCPWMQSHIVHTKSRTLFIDYKETE